jgi:hypothetical protein
MVTSWFGVRTFENNCSLDPIVPRPDLLVNIVQIQNFEALHQNSILYLQVLKKLYFGDLNHITVV